MASSLIDILLIGHSLIGTTMPVMLQDIVKAGHAGDKVNYQVINGAPLRWNWEHSVQAQGVDARAVLPAGDIDVVVMTEAIPLVNHGSPTAPRASSSDDISGQPVLSRQDDLVTGQGEPQ